MVRMSVRIVSALERPDLADQADEATAGAFPEYNTHGDVASPRWSRLYDDYPDFQLVLWDDATGEVLGEANTIPCRFDGTVQGLPRGIDEVLATGLPDVGVPPEPTALCALAIAIPSGQENRGQSRLLLQGMRSLAAERGWVLEAQTLIGAGAHPQKCLPVHNLGHQPLVRVRAGSDQ